MYVFKPVGVFIKRFSVLGQKLKGFYKQIVEVEGVGAFKFALVGAHYFAVLLYVAKPRVFFLEFVYRLIFVFYGRNEVSYGLCVLIRL